MLYAYAQFKDVKNDLPFTGGPYCTSALTVITVLVH